MLSDGDCHQSRTCGRLEMRSVYRNNLQIYSNVVVAMRYVPEKHLERGDFSLAVENALRYHVIPLNPLLSCIIVDGCTDKPKFQKVAIQKISLRMVKDWDDLQGYLRREHDEPPSNEDLWRLSILPDREAFWVSFAFHHAIGDGTAGLIFHEHLLAALKADVKPIVDAALPLPPSIEQCGLKLIPTWKSLLQEVHHIVPVPHFVRHRLPHVYIPFYAGKPTTLEQRRKTKTGLRTIKLETQEVASLRKVAKANHVSIHALIHAAVVHSIDTEKPLKSSTPISLRPLLRPEYRRHIANYVSTHQSITYKGEDLIAEAKKFYEEINTQEARAEAKYLLGKLQYISNHPPKKHSVCGMEQFFLDQLNTSAEHCLGATFEISNLGNWTPPETDGWKVDDIHFTGSNSSVGELLNLGVVTIAGGLMNISCTWRTGYVDEGEVHRLMRRLHDTLINLSA